MLQSLACSFNRQEGVEKHGEPVPLIHVDYTTRSGAERLDALVPKEEAQRLKKTPFAAIQVTRACSCMQCADYLPSWESSVLTSLLLLPSRSLRLIGPFPELLNQEWHQD